MNSVIETNDLNNNHEVTYLNLLIGEYLETREGTRERQAQKRSRHRHAVFLSGRNLIV